MCKICFDEYPVREMRSAACNHRFCKACWKGYIGAKISEGPAVLNMRCPMPDCRAAVRLWLCAQHHASIATAYIYSGLYCM